MTARPTLETARQQSIRCRFHTLTEAGLGFILITPALAVLITLFFYPLFVVVRTSLEGTSGWTTAHYTRFLSDPRSYWGLIRTVEIAVFATVGCIAVSLPIALILRRSLRYRTLMRTLVSVPLMTPVLISAYSLLLFFAQNGLFNYLVVQVLHLVPHPLQICYTLPGVVLACVWRFFPFVAMVVAASLESLDPSLEEAAASMGANSLRRFLDVLLPLLVPSILTGSILVFVGAFGTFTIPLIMGRGEDVLSVLAYRYYEVFFDWSAASTVAVVMVVVQFTLLSVSTKALRRPTA